MTTLPPLVGTTVAEDEGVHHGPQLPLVRHRAMLEVTTSAWARRKPVVLGVYYVAVIAMLLAAGYPHGRVLALGLLFGNSVVMQLWGLSCSGRRHMNLRSLGRAQTFQVGVMTLMYAVTGGLQSPMLVSYLMPLVGALIVFGRSRETKMLVGEVLLGTLLLAVMPAAWHGPAVAQPWSMWITAISIVSALVILWTSMTSLVEAFQRSGAQLHRAREEVAEAAMERARSLEQIGAKVAHELKNPLAAVKGLVQLLGRAPCAKDERTRERLSVVEREVTRMEAILREYLSFTRPLEDLAPQQVQVGELVSDVLQVLEARAESAGVRTSSDGDAQVVGDPRRLKEALLNLVANALEATPRGGAVEVSVTVCELGARIRVTDTGRGMPVEVLDRVGTPFFTTREEGTGLGVTLARAIFVQHGGELRYESKPGQGTTATATIPTRPCGTRAPNGAPGKTDVQSAAGR